MTQDDRRPPSETELLTDSGALVSLLRETLIVKGRLAPHIDLELGGIDDSNLEPFLYRLLGLKNTSPLFVGISCDSTADVELCIEEWGLPARHVELAGLAAGTLCWRIWRQPVSALAQTGVGPGLIVAAATPVWVLYIEPEEGQHLLFLTGSRCREHD